MSGLQDIIFEELIRNEEYARVVLPHIKPEYFTGALNKVFPTLESYFAKYNTLPNVTELSIAVSDDKDVPESQFAEAIEFLKEVEDNINKGKSNISSLPWLIDKTEVWCRNRAVYLAIMDSISIIDGKHKKHLSQDVIPEILSDALSVSFDTHVGHDYFDNADERYDYYQKEEERLPFDLDILNKITKGGLPTKSLTVVLAGTGVGKSMFMCHCAAANLSLGKNVLYITLEMAEKRIAERIDANLLNKTFSELEGMDRDTYMSQIDKLVVGTSGNLVIKEYPTSQAHTGHFRALLNELKMKKKFVPDIIYIDYLNICASSRIRAMGGSINSYSYVKSIAEEVRGLAVEFDLPIMTATQTNRQGFSNSDPTLEDTSESFGLTATADVMFALVSNEELEATGRIMGKQLKNRYNDPNYYRRFMMGVERPKMRLFDITQDEQQSLSVAENEHKDPGNSIDNIPVFDRGNDVANFMDFKVE